MRYATEAYDPCPCGSGKKFKFCCRSSRGHGKYPIGTIVYYGPDDKTCTKIVAGVVKSEGAEAEIERHSGVGMMDDREVSAKIKAFFAMHGVRNVMKADGILGCPHEEGIDFPKNQDCPFCPFWAGKQGSAARE